MSKQQEVYLGNPNLKKANISQEFSAAEVEEYLKCANDPVYFIRQYIYPISKFKIDRLTNSNKTKFFH